MSKLKPISPLPSKPPPQTVKPSTESISETKLPGLRLLPTWTQASPRQPLTGKFRTSSPRARRILDWDLESQAAGFGEPDWVPQRVTAIAWSWIGEDHVSYATLLDGVDYMFEMFLEAYGEADILTGHNLLRFDLPVLQADLLRNDYSPLKSRLVQDTMRIVKTKGFKKGQDNLSTLLENPIQKQSMNWQEWENAYQESDWQTVIDRVTSDVAGHKVLREEMLRRGWLKPAVRWRP